MAAASASQGERPHALSHSVPELNSSCSPATIGMSRLAPMTSAVRNTRNVSARSSATDSFVWYASVGAVPLFIISVLAFQCAQAQAAHQVALKEHGHKDRREHD